MAYPLGVTVKGSDFLAGSPHPAMTQQENPAMNRKNNLLVDEPIGNMANLLPNQGIGPSGSIVIARNR
jgi:hypothetical protein